MGKRSLPEETFRELMVATFMEDLDPLGGSPTADQVDDVILQRTV